MNGMTIYRKHTRASQIDALLELAQKEYEDGKEEPLSSTELTTISGKIRYCSHLLHESTNELLDRVYRETYVDKSQLGKELLYLLCEGYSGQVLHSFIAFRPYLRDATIDESRFLINRVHDYALLPTVENFIDCEPLITEQAAALVITTKYLYAHYNQHPDTEWIPFEWNNGVIISEPSVVQLIIDNPQHAAQIADIMINRKTTDTNLIKSILNHDITALRRGAL